MIMARQMDAKDFSAMVVDNFDEMLVQSRAQPLVMGLALHPYIVGQPTGCATCAGARAPGAGARPGRHLVHHAGGDRSRHGAMPLPSVGITTSRERK
jgi:hypothetical protein